MKLTTAFVALASSLLVEGQMETDRIEATFGVPNRPDIKPGCTMKPLDLQDLMVKYNMNMTNPEHLSALSMALSGSLALGIHSDLIAEASDAGRTGAMVADGKSGDLNFPFGSLKPFATVGEINMCEGDNHGEAFTGVPDGMGAYLVDDDTVRVVVQSESYGPLKYETWPYPVNDGAATFTGSHVHYFDLDREMAAEFMDSGAIGSEIITGFGQVSTKYINLAGDPIGPRNPDGPTTVGAHFSNTDAAGNYVIEKGAPTRADWLMQSLCSAHLAEKHQFGPGLGFEDDIYITNEEWIKYVNNSEFVGISMHAMDLAEQTDYAVGSVTQTGFEKIVEINPASPDYVILAVSGYNGDYSGYYEELRLRNEEYGPRSDGQDYIWTKNVVPARVYVGVKGKMEDGSDAPADDFLARNGLRYGKIYGFAVDMSADGPTGGLFRDDFHKPRENGAQVDGKFVALNWQWDGEVKNYRHDGAWEFQDDVPGYEGTDFKWWNSGGYDGSGAKTEHNSPDTRPGLTAFVQGSTAGYYGHYYLNAVAETLAAANGDLPKEIDATYFVYQGENDISAQIILGGAGLLAINAECPGAVDATVNCDNPESVKSTFEDIDGLEVIAAPDGLYVVLQEDSGNELGERMFIAKLEHESDGEEIDYYFIAQSGGKFNTRMSAGVGVPPGSNEVGASHEFSGIIDLSGMFLTVERRRELEESDEEEEPYYTRGLKKGKKADKKAKGKGTKKDGKGGKGKGGKGKGGKGDDEPKISKGYGKGGKGKGGKGDDEPKISKGASGGSMEPSKPRSNFLVPAGNGYFKRQAELMTPINEKLLVIGLQSHNLEAGAVRAFETDRGGQMYMYQPDI